MTTLLRAAARGARSSSGATILIIGIVAVAASSLTALLAVFDGIWLQAVPYPRARELFLVSARTNSNPQALVRWSELESWRARVPASAVELSAYTQARNVSVRRDTDEWAESARLVETSFFKTLRESPVLGRLFAEEDARSPIRTVVITERFWRNRLHATTDLHQVPLVVDGVPSTIVGVVPDRIRSVQSSNLFLPLGPPATGRDLWNLTVLGRLASGASPAAVQSLFDDSGRHGSPTASMIPLRQVILGAEVGNTLFLILAVAALGLLVAATDVGLVVLTVLERKTPEVRVKFALGGSRSRIVKDLMAEGLIAVTIGVVLAIPLAKISLDGLIAQMPRSIPRVANIHFGWPSVIAALLLLAVVGALTTFLPALWVTRVEARSIAISHGHVSARNRIGQAMVGAQAAIAVCIMGLALVLCRSYLLLTHQDIGFDPVNVVQIDFLTATGSYLRDAGTLGLEQDVLEGLKARPDVMAAGVTDQPPLGGSTSIYGLKTVDSESVDEVPTYYRRIGPGYLEAMKMQVLRGRSFTTGDKAGAPSVVLVNETAAHTFWRNADPLWKVLYATPGEPLRVIGVVRDIKSEGLDRISVPEVYRSRLQEPLGGAIVFVRTVGDPAALLASLKDSPVVPGVLVKSAVTLQDVVETSVSKPRFRAQVVALFGLTALALAMTGIAGLTARAVSRRTREIAMRIALGATGGGCVRFVMWQSLVPVFIGAALGLLIAAWSGRLLRGLIFGISETDPVSMSLAAVLALLLTAIVAYVPASRAASIDPAQILRGE